MQAGSPQPKSESETRRRRNERRGFVREQNDRRRRQNGRKRPQKRLRKLASKLDLTAQKESVTNSRHQTATKLRKERQDENPEFYHPDSIERFGYWVALAVILGVIAINLILGRAAILHLIGLESGGVLIKLLALITIPVVMMATAIWIAYGRREAEELGYRGYKWLFASLLLLSVTPLLSIATQLGFTAGLFQSADWVLLAAKIVLNLVVEMAILFGGDRLFDALGYWSFQASNTRSGLKIWNQERSLRKLRMNGVHLFTEIFELIDNYNARYDPDILPPPAFSELTRNFVNTLLDYEAIPRPFNPNQSSDDPPIEDSPAQPPHQPTPPTPQPAPAPPNPSEQADPHEAAAAEDDYYQNLDERDIRRRDRQVEL
jgi:hypothetical protein